MYHNPKQSTKNHISKSDHHSPILKARVKTPNEKLNYTQINPQHSLALNKSQGYYHGVNHSQIKYHHNKSKSITNTNKHISSKKHNHNFSNSFMQNSQSFNVKDSLNISNNNKSMNVSSGVSGTGTITNELKNSLMKRIQKLSLNNYEDNNTSNNISNPTAMITDINLRPKQNICLNFNLIKQSIKEGKSEDSEKPTKLYEKNEFIGSPKANDTFIDLKKISSIQPTVKNTVTNPALTHYNSFLNRINLNNNSSKFVKNIKLDYNKISNINNAGNSNMSSIQNSSLGANTIHSENSNTKTIEALNDEKFNMILTNLENQFIIKLSQNPTNSKSKKYNTVKNTFEDFIKAIPLSNKKLLIKIITGYHEVVNAFVNENRTLKEANEINALKISNLEKEKKELEKKIKELKEFKIKTESRVQVKSNEIEPSKSTTESLAFGSIENNLSIGKETNDNKYIIDLNKKNMVQDIGDLDALYFFDKVKMKKDSREKSPCNKSDIIPKLNFNIVDKISTELNKGININAINAGLNGNIPQKKKKEGQGNNKGSVFDYCKEAFK
ncbi:MAG: hypothetical protein MJ252_27095 [archaeon]|nr:hypothetical protein [archaeon]